MMSLRQSFILLSSFVVVTALLPTTGLSQIEPGKRPGPAPQEGPLQPLPVATTAGPAGAPMMTDNFALHEQLASTMQHLRDLAVESQALSQTFVKLAATHHGADRSEILVMERMSEAMGTMSAEVRASLAQYRQMLDNETASDSGAMKAEVQELKAALDIMAGEIDDAMQTLRTLQGQLGQG